MRRLGSVLNSDHESFFQVMGLEVCTLLNERKFSAEMC